jgi:hypothetical protein
VGADLEAEWLELQSRSKGRAMCSVMKRAAAMAGVGLLGLTLAAPAQCQSPFFQQVPPGLMMQQNAFNMATMGRAAAFGSPFGPVANPLLRRAVALGQLNAAANANAFLGAASMSSSPYLGGAATLANMSPAYGGSGYGFNPYFPYYYQDPLNGYLTGGAAVIGAQGQFMIARQQAALLRQQVQQASLDTRRRMVDEYLYEREKLPTPEEERERRALQERDRARNDPPITEIWSAKALNDLLTDLQRLRAKGTLATFKPPEIRLDADDLARINVTSAKSGGGNIGLLKNDGRLSWPAALNAPEFKEERERINSLAQEAVKQAGFNSPVDPGTLKQLSNDLEKLNRQLVNNVGNLPPSQYIEAKRFVSQFEEALKALSQPDVGKYFTKKIKAKTVAELVDHMNSQGLQFAPAVAGDESAYVALHRALAAFDLAAQNQVAEK